MKAVIAVGDFIAACGGVALAASEDETRAHMNGVRIESEAEVFRIIATDGHMCAIWEGARHADSEGECAITIPLATVREMLRVAKGVAKKERAKTFVTISEDAISIAGITAAYVPAEDHFPSWRQIVPQERNGGTQTIGFTAALMARVCEIFQRAGSTFFAMNIGGELDPALFTNRTGLRVILMPARV